MNDAIGGVVVRYAEVDGYAEPLLDEVVGGYVHVESMGDHVWAMVAETPSCLSCVHMSFYAERLPLSRWWDAILDAIWGRTWPSFHRVGMRITSDERRALHPAQQSVPAPNGEQK